MSRPRYLPAHLRTGSEEAAAVARVFRSVGCTVYTTSDTRRTKSTPGIPDHIILHPRFLILWDAKAGRGRPSPEQMAFFTEIARRSYKGVLTGWGDAEAARQFLMRLA